MPKTKVKLALVKVQHVAKLAGLVLTKDEEIKLPTQLTQIIDYVNKLNIVKTDKVKPTNQVTNLQNRFREDIIKPSLPQKDVLLNVKESHNGYFKIKAIF